MKNTILFVLTFIITKLTFSQTTSTFESLLVGQGFYWNGISNPLGASFSDGNTICKNYYDTSYGGFWSSGWAYSNLKDTITAGFTNLYSSISGKGSNDSKVFIIGQNNSILNFKNQAIGKIIYGLYVNNSTYPALSMENGDAFAKKFGGTSGNDTDWFKLTIKKYYGGVLSSQGIETYLADFRFTDNTKDYILKSWNYIDLSSLGNVDSLYFELSSSDNGTFGMNTPGFFCIDNVITKDYGVNIESINESQLFSIYPNPTIANITITFNNTNAKSRKYELYDAMGKNIQSNIISDSNKTIFLDNFQAGMYFIKVIEDNSYQIKRFNLQ